jgi:hypothetical protein
MDTHQNPIIALPIGELDSATNKIIPLQPSWRWKKTPYTKFETKDSRRIKRPYYCCCENQKTQTNQYNPFPFLLFPNKFRMRTAHNNNNTTTWRRSKALALLPLGIFVLALGTIVAAYHATFSNELLEFQHGRIKTPPISMLMFAGPGRRIGQVGFPLVSILFGIISPTFYRVILHETTTPTRGGGGNASSEHNAYQRIIGILKISSTIAFACLAIVGAIPLQENVGLVLQRQASIGIDSIIHQSAAGFFFFFCILHMGTWLFFCRFRASADLPFYYKNSSLSFCFKLVCFVTCFFPLPTAFLLHPISPLRKRLALSEADEGGITQYALVACVSSFFASYSLEMWQHVSSLEESSMKNRSAKSGNKVE